MTKSQLIAALQPFNDDANIVLAITGNNGQTLSVLPTIDRICASENPLNTSDITAILIPVTNES